jgi:hypothetical protein
MYVCPGLLLGVFFFLRSSTAVLWINPVHRSGQEPVDRSIARDLEVIVPRVRSGRDQRIWERIFVVRAGSVRGGGCLAALPGGDPNVRERSARRSRATPIFLTPAALFAVTTTGKRFCAFSPSSPATGVRFRGNTLRLYVSVCTVTHGNWQHASS